MSSQSWNEVLTNSIVDGPTLTGASAASCIPTANVITLPNNFLTVGKMLRITATGRISRAITTPGTARFDIRVGVVVAWDSGAILLDTVAAHTTMPWRLDILLTVRAQGSGTSGNMIGNGMWTCEDILGTPATAPKGSLTALLPWNAAPLSALDTTRRRRTRWTCSSRRRWRRGR